VGVEWHRRRTLRGTIVHAVLTHDGELSAEDLERCLQEIAEGERLLKKAAHPERARRHAKAS
jgi:metal-dependent HD superfamily phosphatase/phosphodiesterase